MDLSNFDDNLLPLMRPIADSKIVLPEGTGKVMRRRTESDAAEEREEFGPFDRDQEAAWRMQYLNEQLKVVHKHKFPLCGDCLEFHAKWISCDNVLELMHADRQLGSPPY